MKDHKVIDVLKQFDSKTVSRFVDFLHSPYHNKVERITKLGGFLLRYYPSFDSEELSEEAAFVALFGKKAFNKHELTRYLSKLFILLEDFIIAESLGSETFLKSNLKTDFYYKIQNASRFKKAQTSALKELQKKVRKESANYFFLYLNQKQAHDFHIQSPRKQEARTFFKGAVKDLNAYYFIEILQAATTMKFQFDQQETEDYIPLLYPTLAYIGKHKLAMPTLVLIWYYAYQALREPGNVARYKDLKDELHKAADDLPFIDARNITNILKRTIKSQTSRGRHSYLKEMFTVYKMEVEQGWVVADGIINYQAFNNVITLALILEEIDFAASFLTSYQKYLIPEVREDIVFFNEARIAFAQKDYRRSLACTLQTAYLDLLITLGVKRTQIKCYFELDDSDQLIHALNAFTVYLHRMPSELAQEKLVKKKNDAFVKAVKLLAKVLSEPDQTKARMQLNEVLQANPLMPEKEWIEGKL